jgi:hypothetical protein
MIDGVEKRDDEGEEEEEKNKERGDNLGLDVRGKMGRGSMIHPTVRKWGRGEYVGRLTDKTYVERCM